MGDRGALQFYLAFAGVLFVLWLIAEDLSDEVADLVMGWLR